MAVSAPQLRVDARIGGEPLWTQIGPALDLSPEGDRIAYITGGETHRQLWVRQLNQLDPTKLTEGGGADNSPYHPFFSPDGAWVGYATSSELRKIPTSGGTPLTLCKVNRSRGASWGADDSIIFTPSPNDALYRIPAAGGEAKPLTTLDKAKKELTHRWPQILPGGAAVLFTAHSQAVGNFDNASIEVATIATGERKVVHSGGSFGRYVPSGHLIFVNKGTVFAAPFDLKRLEVTGTPVPIVQNVMASSDEGAMQLVFAASGVMDTSAAAGSWPNTRLCGSTATAAPRGSPTNRARTPIPASRPMAGASHSPCGATPTGTSGCTTSSGRSRRG